MCSHEKEQTMTTMKLPKVGDWKGSKDSRKLKLGGGATLRVEPRAGGKLALFLMVPVSFGDDAADSAVAVLKNADMLSYLGDQLNIMANAIIEAGYDDDDVAGY